MSKFDARANKSPLQKTQGKNTAKEKSSVEKAKDQVAQARLQKVQEAEAHWEMIREHVMNGEVELVSKGNKGKKETDIVGFHSKRNLGKSGCHVRMANDGVETPLSMGCYQANISSLDGSATKMSTFFPKNWTEEDIKDAVVSAYQSRVQNVGHGSNKKVQSMPIMFMGGKTAFPYFGT